MEGVSEEIIRLFFEWFPCLERLHGGFVFGGVLREMWYAAGDTTTITSKMLEYFRSGGDVDFYIDPDQFYRLTGDDPEYWDSQFHTNNVFSQIKSIEPVISGYELHKINKRMERIRQEELEMYGVEDAFRSRDLDRRHFLVKLEAQIGGETIEVSMDMITAETPIDRFDFSCNMLKLQCSDQPLLVLGYDAKNCRNLEEFNTQVKDKKIRVLDSGGKATKVIYRLGRRMQVGWTVDTSDEIGLSHLALTLKNAIISRGDDRYHDDRTQRERDIDEICCTFISDQSEEMLAIFLACRNQIRNIFVKEINEYVGRHKSEMAAFEKSPSYKSMSRLLFCIGPVECLVYLLELCVRHNQLGPFVKWCEEIPVWSPRFYHSLIVKVAAKYCPESLAGVVKLYPFQTNGDAVEFLHNLMKFDRRDIFLKYLKSVSFKRTITLFNTLSDEEKCNCCLFSGIFAYDFRRSVPDFKMDYFMLLLENGLILPKKLHMNGHLKDQTLPVLDFLFDQGLIGKEELFPKDKDLWMSRCLNPTEDNMRWILSKDALKITQSDVERMVKELHSFDFGFLFLYKEFCKKNGTEPQSLTWIFQQGFESNVWSNVEKYFEYRFDTIHPTMRQVATLPMKSDWMCFTTCVMTHRDPASLARVPFRKLVRMYGPHLFLGLWKNSLNYGGLTGDDRSWFSLVYWLWRIAHNPDNPIPAAWSIPNDVILIMLEGWDSTTGASLLFKEWRDFYFSLQ